MSGDVCGIPLLLHSETKEDDIKIWIPEHGIDLFCFVTTYSDSITDTQKRRTLHLSLILTISSLPAEKKGLHEKNSICMYMPLITFMDDTITKLFNSNFMN